MKSFFRKVTAAVMAAAILTTGILVGSALASEGQETAAPQNTPLRSTFEGMGANVLWADGQITVTFGGDTWIFTPDARSARLNSNEITLTAPVIITNGTAMISAADAARLNSAEDTPIGITPEIPAAQFAQTTAMAEAAVAQVMEQMGVAGVTVALVDARTGFTWTQGFGMADTNRNIPADADTMFQIGSVSKQFTAIAVMQLVEQGLVNLDAPLVNYIPEFSILPSSYYGGNSDNITVRMLLNNTSGVPSNWMRAFYVTGDDHYQGTVNNLLDWLQTRELSFVPGTRYDYANNNWVLLGILVSRVAEHTNDFEGFVLYTDEHIFAPLGMTRSTFEHSANLTNVAQPHISTGVQEEMHLVSKNSAGSIMASANDMAKYLHFMLGGEAQAQILTQASINEMLRIQTGHVEMSLPQLGYGLGIIQMQLPDGFQIVGHSGGTMHYFSDLLLDVDTGIGVFVSTNSTTGVLAVQSLSVGILQSAIMEKTGSIPRAPVEGPTMDPDAVPVELTSSEIAALEKLVGVYDFGIGGLWTLSLADNGIAWTGPSGELEATTPMSDGTFQGQTGRYIFDTTGVISVTYISPAIGMIPGTKMTSLDSHLATDDFNRWVGRYYFVPSMPNDVVGVSFFEFSVNHLGMATVLQHAHAVSIIEQFLGDVMSPSPLTLIDGTWFLGTTPMLFYTDADGNAALDFLGATFVRR